MEENTYLLNFANIVPIMTSFTGFFAPYSLKNNGIDQRKNMSLCEIARCLLHHPTPSLRNKTQISKKIPNIKQFQKLIDYVYFESPYLIHIMCYT
jgi:hypothetical protein